MRPDGWRGWGRRVMPLPQRGLVLCLLLLIGTERWGLVALQEVAGAAGQRSVGEGKFGDKCHSNEECGFEGSVCDETVWKCQCQRNLTVTNHIDKCGKEVRVNESCFFTEQCEAVTAETECRDGVCVCRFEKVPITKSDGHVECVVIQNSFGPERYVDPAMIGILVAMFLMFITICVVLRLFSRY